MASLPTYREGSVTITINAEVVPCGVVSVSSSYSTPPVAPPAEKPRREPRVIIPSHTSFYDDLREELIITT